MIKVYGKFLDRDEIYNLWIDYDYRIWKNVEDEILNFFNNV